MAYTLATVHEKHLTQEFLSRDCGGFFEHVWGVHPIADVPHNTQLAYDGFRPSVVAFAPNQTVIEGVSAYYRFLRRLYPLNVLVSQVRFAMYLVRLVRREGISVVLSSDPYLCGLLGVIIKYLTGTPLVVWVVANYADVASSTGKPIMPRLFRKRWVESLIERFVFSRADLVAGGNNDNLEFALRNGARRAKSTVFPVGKLIHPSHLIDPAVRTLDPAVQKWKGSRVFVYVGRLIETKCPEDVVRAFADVHRRDERTALVMVGDGTMREQLGALAKDMGLEANVSFVGAVHQQRLSEILPGCFAALSPLTGRALIEVALAGLPVVAYDRDWQREFVDTSKGGIVVPFRDWRAMAAASIDLLGRADDARSMGHNARRRALELCDLTQLYKHEQEAYEKLFALRPSATQ